MRVPQDVYLDFITRNALYREVVQSNDMREFLRSSWLFADGVSCVTLKHLVQAAAIVKFEGGTAIDLPIDHLLVLSSGNAELRTRDGLCEALHASNHCGAGLLSGLDPGRAKIHFTGGATAYRLPVSSVENIPVVRWKLRETHLRRYPTVEEAAG